MLLFRCDAGPSIGAGHFYRDFAIAEAASIHGEPSVFVCASLPKLMRANLVSIGAFLVEIDSEIGSQDDFKETLMACEYHQPRVVFLDGYRFSPDYAKSLDASYPTVVIDDIGEQKWEVSAVVNVNLYGPKLTYNVPERTRLFLGLSYALIRKSFLDARTATGPNEFDLRRVFVTMGGGDSDNLTARVIRSIQDLDTAIDVMVGAAYSHSQDLAREFGDRINLYENVQNPAPLMARASLAVSGAGGTTWELACLGIPTIHIVVAENQHELARATDALGITELAGEADFDCSSLRGQVDELLDAPDRRKKMAEAARGLVDGQGPQRLLDALEELERTS